MPRNHRALQYGEQIIVRVPTDQARWLVAEATRRSVSISEIVRELVQAAQIQASQKE